VGYYFAYTAIAWELAEIMLNATKSCKMSLVAIVSRWMRDSAIPESRYSSDNKATSVARAAYISALKGLSFTLTGIFYKMSLILNFVKP
jgi:hypothetical protein